MFRRWPVALNLLANPLVDAGIAFALLLCAALFYTPLARVYGFAPVPWHVYAFALHAGVLLLAVTELRKARARRAAKRRPTTRSSSALAARCTRRCG